MTIHWELIKKQLPSNVPESDLDTSSLILDNTAANAPFFSHSSVPSLFSLWKNTDSSESQPANPVSFSPSYVNGENVNTPPLSMPVPTWNTSREAPTVSATEYHPERYQDSINYDHPPSESFQLPNNNYYQMFGQHSTQNEFNQSDYGYQNRWQTM